MIDTFIQALDQVQAEESFKQNTRAFLARKRKVRPVRVVRRVCAAACLAVAVALAGGYGVYAAPVSVIGIDAGVSLELGVNRFERVVSAKELGAEDTSVDLSGLYAMHYTDALETILCGEEMTSYLAQEGELSIVVIDGDEQMLEQVRACTGQQNAHCYAGSEQEMEQAHSAGLSYGKYRLLLAIQQLDPSVTAQDVQGMSMCRLRELLAQLQQGQSAEAPASQQGNARQGQSHGHGQPRHGCS